VTSRIAAFTRGSGAFVEFDVAVLQEARRTGQGRKDRSELVDPYDIGGLSSFVKMQKGTRLSQGVVDGPQRTRRLVCRLR
jgi:hypothetical protein